MIASLPMYVHAGNRKAQDAFWELVRDGLRTRGIEAPDALDYQIGHLESWAHPGLVLGQICNLPYRALFADRVTRIGAADFGLEGCAPGMYRSIFVVRTEDPAQSIADCDGYRLAYNEPMSQSGWAAPWAAARRHGIAFVHGAHTHAHRASLAAVAGNLADLAAIDAQTLWLYERFQPDLLAGLRKIGASHTSPGMTFITRKGEDPAPYAAAIREAITAMPPALAGDFGLKGLVVLDDTHYHESLPPTFADLPNWAT